MLLQMSGYPIYFWMFHIKIFLFLFNVYRYVIFIFLARLFFWNELLNRNISFGYQYNKTKLYVNMYILKKLYNFNYFLCPISFSKISWFGILIWSYSLEGLCVRDLNSARHWNQWSDQEKLASGKSNDLGTHSEPFTVI